MQLTICAVFDSAANAFMRPIFTQHVGQAVRSFSDEVNRPATDNVMFQHPEDFSLHELGTFDEATGTVAAHDPRQVARGQDVSKARGAD